MKIVCIIDDLEMGGTEQGLLTIARRLPADVQLHVVVLFGDGVLSPEFASAGARLTHLHARRITAPLAFLRVLIALGRTRPDAVMGLRVTGRITAALAGRIAAVPVVARWDGMPGSERPEWRHIERLSALLAHRLTASAQGVAAAVGQIGGVPPARVRVIPMPIPGWNATSLPSRQEMKERLAIPPDAPVVGTVANFNWRKDYPTLLRAAALVVRRMPSVRFLLIGEGADRPAMEALARELDLGEAALFLGRRQDVPGLLRAMDVFALSSVTEGFPVALREAMWAGLPCAATSVGGVPEAVADGETGLLVPPRDPEALAESIVRLLDSADLRRRFGEAGRRLVETRFGTETIVRQFTEVCVFPRRGRRPCE